MSHTYEDLLAEWEYAKQQTALWSKKEREMREMLFQGAVPEPKEGVNNVELADGRICKFTHKVNRTLRDAESLREELAALGLNDVDKYVVPKFDLGVAAYKKATGKTRKTMDKYVTSKPGTPTLEVR